MKVERENITGNNIEQYLNFICNYQKQEEEKQKGDMDKKLAKMKRKRKHATTLLAIWIKNWLK